ncbi:hypothetical protein G6F70_008831 [Rhizopus microsporus]|nr:hypothetical protein G6F71_009012 [Rhizopus microsporus]KAG1194498.1 hypothetical protein G6F70_008831 [Rhizopus microsporus]KAG1206124.1 hypothetical protein G6F69_009061 [Rhizopus microsporus]KAG1226265.1 hypothetical protein G6F67_009052 [Rhizopus microsporus]KAG1257773.1 hypothetical protein G6F68_009143 [Rhizopus microsporus]
MRTSAPLKGPVSIKGIVVECTFDSGAAVSVMSESLANKLDLEVNGDQMHLTSFDSIPREPCSIVPNVPVRIGGHLRSEHMCIQRNPKKPDDDYCILGMTWFKAYGASIRAKDNIISFPIAIKADPLGGVQLDWSEGVVEIQGYSSHDSGFSSVMAEPASSVVSNQILAVSVSAVRGNSQSTTTVDHHLSTVVEDVLEGSLVVTPVGGEDALDFSGVPDFLKNLVMAYQDCFVEVSGLGRVDLVRHEIPIKTDAIPIKSRPFRLTWEEQDQMARELKEMVDLGLIRPSKGVWSSPCFFVRKKDGTLRLVIDYRRLNKITIKDNYPLPIIDTVLDTLAGACVFSTLDAASGYHQVPMDSTSIEKTGFITPHGTYEFQVMPFGLTSAPATYQRMMGNLLSVYLGQFVMVFIDDVIVFSKDNEEHKEHLKLVFERCRKAGLRLKFKKCSFGAPSVEYLGHTISKEGVSPHAHNMDKIMKFPIPRSADDVRSFLGTCGYYRRFIDGYANLASPLTELLKKKQIFSWGPKQEDAYQSLKKQLVSAPVLAYPDRDQVQILTTDASSHGISAILSQSPDGTAESERVISYNSRTLRPAEKNYATVHLEALAVVWAVTKYRHYLMGRHFKLRTDNSAVTYIMNPSKASQKLSRWAACLIEYDFEIIHLPGHLNPADSLSRLFPQ